MRQKNYNNNNNNNNLHIIPVDAMRNMLEEQITGIDYFGLLQSIHVAFNDISMAY